LQHARWSQNHRLNGRSFTVTVSDVCKIIA
jgi:hypothetical protein